jgi:hypothetical protein
VILGLRLNESAYVGFLVAGVTYEGLGRDGEIETGDEGCEVFGGGAISVPFRGLQRLEWGGVEDRVGVANLVGGDCVWAEEFIEPGADGSVALVEVETSYKCLTEDRNFNCY